MDCAYDLNFGEEYNEFESCDDCCEKNKEAHEECRIEWDVYFMDELR